MNAAAAEDRAVWFVVALGAAGLLGLALTQCSVMSTTEAYRHDLLSCVSNAHSKPEADACRTAVDLHYCGKSGALNVAGGCDLVTIPDAGGDK